MTFKEKLLQVSIALVWSGLGCLPRPLTSDIQTLSTFNVLASGGGMTGFGLAAIGLGCLVGMASLLLKR